ncbi:MAG: CBS domain-containing protein [Eubacteriales bacterium]
MNILFFLTPKISAEVIEETDTLRQVLEKMERHGYTAVPLLSKEGHYIGTLTEGDILWKMRQEGFPSLKEMEDIHVLDIVRKRDNLAVNVQTDMEGLMEKAVNQNFVPVVDDNNVFIGIVTRKDIILYLCKKQNL